MANARKSPFWSVSSFVKKLNRSSLALGPPTPNLRLTVAVGSNYALFFDRLSQGADAFAARTLASLGLANATTVAGFGVLSLSSVPVLQAIGSTVALGAFLTLVFSAIMMGPRSAVVPA